MADLAQPCSCTSYTNICCCPPKNGITPVQPTCQTLPDGSTVNNPAFVPDLTKSFWTYKFLTDCDQDTRAISNFGIPICELISAENIIVSEKIDGCGQFVSVPFTLTKNDPNLGVPPTGYQYLKIETNGRYDKGVCVEYRLEIIGNFPIGVQSIKVKADGNIYTFSCDKCYLVPKCDPEGKLAITKNCNSSIINNQATLNYNVHVTNTGNSKLDNVQFEDMLFIPTQLSIGNIIVMPSELAIDTSLPGEIKISGNLGTITPGQTLNISYIIQINSVVDPGRYIVNNTANVYANNTSDSSTCNTLINVVKLDTNKCCKIDGKTINYILTVTSVGNSPDVIVDIYDSLQIPAGVTINPIILSGCEGRFIKTTTPIPRNTPITGPAELEFICKNALVPAGGSYIRTGIFELISCSVVGTSTITNTVTNVIPVDDTQQIFLTVSNLPASANVNVQFNPVCTKPCN
jgi:uncharacterized repeat protein (TIGR01451 family)